MVGRGDLAETLRTDIRNLGLEEKAWMTPYCHDMPLAMNAIDCLVHPQIGTEALGLVICEAHACGKPVIASAIDGIPEAFAPGNLGSLIPPDSVPALATALVASVNQPRPTPDEREQMHRRVVEKFSLRVAAENVLRLYRSLQPSSATHPVPLR